MGTAAGPLVLTEPTATGRGGRDGDRASLFNLEDLTARVRKEPLGGSPTSSFPLAGQTEQKLKDVE